MVYDLLLSDFIAKKYSSVIKKINTYLDELDDSETQSRRILLNCRATSYLRMGIYRRCIKDCEAASAIDPMWLEPIYTLVQALVKTKKIEEAKEVYNDWKNVTTTVDLFLQKKIEVCLKLEPSLTQEEKENNSKKKSEGRKKKIEERKLREKRKAEERKVSEKKEVEERKIREKREAEKRKKKIEEDRLSKIQREKHEKSKFAFTAILTKSGHFKKAIVEYGLLLKENPDLVRAYIERGALYATLQKYNKAIKDLINATRRDPHNANALTKLAQIRVKHAEYLCTIPNRMNEGAIQLNNAIQEISRSISLLQNTDDTNSTFSCLRQRAFIFRQQANHKRARLDFEEALKLKPNHVETLITTGLCLSDLGLCEDSIEMYNVALSKATDEYIGTIHNNLALSYHSLGKIDEEEKNFSKAIKAGHTNSYAIRGMCRYFNGNIQRCIKDMNKSGQFDGDDISNLQLRLQVRGVAYHSLGAYRWAEKDYAKMIATNPPFPGMLSWYRHQMLPITQGVLDKKFKDYNFDRLLDKSLKTQYVQMKIPSTVSKSYKPNNGKVSTRISDVNLNIDLTPHQKRLCVGARRLDHLLNYPSSPGFLANPRQRQMFGLAVVEIVQTLRSHWKKSIQVSGKASSVNHEPHTFMWRDMMDIAVRWRQHSEPNDGVFWVDLLDNLSGGNGTHTKIMDGQKKNTKYYEYHDRTFRVMKPLVCEQKKHLSDFDRKMIMEAKTLDDVYKTVGGDFMVVVPIQSCCGGGTLQGTRIILLSQPPEDYCFSIQIPISPERDESFSKELTHVFDQLEELKNEEIDLEKSLELSLSFFYYWINYGGLSRGTAACGLIILNALLISTGYLITVPIPGMQIDWEAILSPTHKEFIKKVRGKITAIPLSEDTGGTSFNDLPKASKHISTLRDLIHVLNVKD